MRDENAPRARRVSVSTSEFLRGDEQPDYADAFEIHVPETDERTAEQFARCALEQAQWPVRWTIRIAHRFLLRFKAAGRSSPNRIFGFRILTSRPDVVHLEASSSVMRGVLVARRADPTRAVMETYVFYNSRKARVLWRIAGPIHRRVAPYLMEHAASFPNSAGSRSVSRSERATAGGIK